MGKNASEPVQGRRRKSDNSFPDVWVRRCMLLTPEARTGKPSSNRRPQVGMCRGQQGEEEEGGPAGMAPAA